MGLPANKIPAAVRDRLGLKLGPGGRAAPRLGEPLRGHVLLDLAVDPPTVTHHAKRIERRGTRNTLVDSPELRAARALYESAIPARPGEWVPPLLPPVVLRVTWTFRVGGALGALGAAELWHAAKPDADNSLKLLTDVLADRGYLADDAHVSLVVAAKRVGAAGRVRVYLRTLCNAGDLGHELPVEGRCGVIWPLPAQAIWDTACGGSPEAVGERPIGGCKRGGGKRRVTA